jgi:hypothetical protein
MNAKKFALITAGLCATMFFAACDSTEKQNTSAGAMGEKSSCCTDAKKCDTKCTSDAKTCTKGAECCMTKATATTPTSAPAVAPGAVGEKKEGCCSTTTKTSAKVEGCSSTTTKTSDKVEGCSSTTTKTSAKASSCCPAMTEGAKCPVTGTTNG